ncbi:MAG TPA: serine hydroxymethyltransferase [Candidatus Limnocylindrales bacterium]|nr:serine hydroxymethyltransferase [Candidatus Limnocylindrales bacterium]
MSTKSSKIVSNLLWVVDPELASVISDEQRRQEENLIMIASENLVSRAVLEAQGSILTNKYAEGYAGARYYGGCTYVDQAEELACNRARELFEAEHVNVQPHSGTSANMAVYLALLNPGDRILGMDLSHGGHLTHGSKVNISGRYYQSFRYGVDFESGLINMEVVRKKAHATKPKLIIAGASSYPRCIDFEAFQEIAREVGAVFMVDMAHTAGLVAAGLHPNPVLCADVVTATTHKTFRGPRGGIIFCRHEYASAIDKAVFPGLQGGPLMHIIAAKAVALKEAQSSDYVDYQKAVLRNASVLADALSEFGFDLLTGGTDTHLVLLDLRKKEITGMEAERLLDKVNITVNKNVIPFDPTTPQITSGIRLGTPTLTSRGMGTEQMREIARLISDVFISRNSESRLAEIKCQVEELCREHPVY